MNTDDELDIALDNIRTLLDPTIRPEQLDDHLKNLTEESEGEFDFNVEKALGDPSSRSRLVNVWPEYYAPEDIEVVLRRWLAFTGRHNMCVLYLAAMNPMLRVDDFWFYADEGMDEQKFHYPASAFFTETFFRHNPNAILALVDDPSSWDEKYIATSSLVIWPMTSWVVRFQGKRTGDEKRQVMLNLLATWLEGSPHHRLRDAGSLLLESRGEDRARSMGINGSIDSVGEVSDQKYYLKRIRLSNQEITPEHLAWALEVSCYLQMAHSWSQWDLAFFLFSAILKGQAGWGDPRITLDKFVAWYGLVVPEIQRLADLLGEPWSPPLETVL